MTDVRLVFCSCPGADAQRIATALVAERLAACVTMLPGARAVYRWRGAVEEAEEVQLIVKTTGARTEALLARLVMLHPYELPEAIAVEAVGGLPGYLAWISDATDPAADVPT